MKILTDPKEPVGFSTSAAIGNFDGVHTGHRAIIRMLKEHSDSTKSCVITFDPHPQKVIANRDIPLIVPLPERIRLLEEQGIDYLACLQFTRQLSLLSARDFVKEILVRFLNIRNLVVGPDFTFGHKRGGNLGLLEEMGNEYNFRTITAQHATVDGEIVSSSRIREFLQTGDVAGASRFLGYRYYIKGKVVEGEKRGRQIGYPTVNLDTEWESYPKTGVYATFAQIGGRGYRSITNIGYRPTFGDDRLLIESHIFDFSENIYGNNVKLEFVERVRGEQKFKNADLLVRQIRKDVQQVDRILSSARQTE